MAWIKLYTKFNSLQAWLMADLSNMSPHIAVCNVAPVKCQMVTDDCQYLHLQQFATEFILVGPFDNCHKGNQTSQALPTLNWNDVIVEQLLKYDL